MDTYQFIADIFKSLVSLAWPIAFVAAVWLFRERLTELLPLVRLKYKDFDVSFRLDQAEKDAAQLPPPAEPSVEPTPEEKSRFEQIAELSPRAAILELRNELEEELRRLFARASDDEDEEPSQLSIGLMTRLLRRNHWLDSKTSALLDDLRVIGNNAAHDKRVQFSRDDALRFRQLVEETIPRIRRAASKGDSRVEARPLNTSG